MNGRIKIPDVYKRECERYCNELIKEQANVIGNEEIQKMLTRNERGINIIILWTVRKFFGSGKAKLREFFDTFDKNYFECGNKYDYTDRESIVFAMDQELKRIGVDVDTWMKQNEKEKEQNGEQKIILS